MCENYEFFEIDRIKRLSWYCEKIIDEYLRMFTEFNDEFWQKIKKILRKKYEKQNVNQQMNTKEFFEALIRKFRTKKNLKIYCRQFYAIFTKLYKRKRLNEHIRMRWFFQRLSKKTIIKIMKKHNYDDIDDEMLNFEIMHKTTIKMSDVAKILKKLIVIISSENRFKHLIENSQFFVLSFINKIDIFISTMIKFIVEIKNVDQLIQMLFDLTFAFRAQIDQFFIFAVSINYFRNTFNTAIIYLNNIFFEQVEENMQKKNNDYFFCWKLNHWKRDCQKLQILINNEHVYVNDESFFKICQDKSKNAKFSLRFSKNVNQLNEILFTFELNANVHFSIRANVLSMTIEIFENAANYIYDLKEEKYRFFRIKVLSQKKKKRIVWKSMKKKFFESWKKKAKRKKKFSTIKFVRIDNYVSEEINDENEMMKNVEIKSTNKFSLFQEFDEKFENIKSNFKKRMFTKKLTNIIKNDVQLNKLIKKMLNQAMKKITIKFFFSCFHVLQKLGWSRMKLILFHLISFSFHNEMKWNFFHFLS